MKILRALSAIGIYCVVITANTVFVRDGLQPWAAAAFEVIVLCCLVFWNIHESDKEERKLERKRRLEKLHCPFCGSTPPVIDGLIAFGCCGTVLEGEVIGPRFNTILCYGRELTPSEQLIIELWSSKRHNKKYGDSQ